ncbi:MAG: N-6 DNA methylase [Eubacterium sp.]|nr:N-6 DNA methylase [Eubacterium sp.]
MWEGTYASRTAQSYYDWGVVAEHFEGMRLLGMLPALGEQLSIEIDEMAEEKSPAFSFTQEIIDHALAKGSSFKHGKFRIYSYFIQGHTTKERADFLKKEYGTGGRSTILAGTGIGEEHDAKGLKLHRGYAEVAPQLLLPWNKVAKRIDELIAVGRYMTKRELEYIPEYEKGVLTEEIYSFFYNQPEEVIRPYPMGAGYYKAIEVIRPQLDKPERVEEILHSMEEVLDNTADFAGNYQFMKKTLQDMTDYNNGVYSLFTPIPPAENTIFNPVLTFPAPTGAEEKIEKKEEEDKPEKDTGLLEPYDLQLDTIVFIGLKEYRIEVMSPERVVLRDEECPLFAEEMSRAEFDRKVRENPANDHLKIQEKQPELPDEISKTETKVEIIQADEQNFVERTNEDVAQDNFTVAERNYRTIMELAPGVLQGKEDSATFEAGTSFMPLTIEVVGNDRIAISHFIEENGDLLADPDMEFEVSHETKTLNARMYQQDTLRRFENVIQNGMVNEELEDELNEFAEQWFTNIQRNRYKLVIEPQKEEKAAEFIPIWEQEPQIKSQTNFILHPEIPQERRNQYHIKNDELGQGTPKEKFRANIAAIQVLKKCEEEGRLATPEEQKWLSGYVGWGGLSDAFDETKTAWGTEYLELKTVLTPEEYDAAKESTLTAFYTPPVVIRAMYQVLENMGLKSGNILEPSCGIGNFIGMKPESLSDCRIFGVELDSVSGRIARQLYQKSTVAVQGYEEANLPDSFFDVAVGNVPFGQFKVLDQRYDKHNFLIHDYFFAKTLDKVRPGGVIAFITSSGTMDKKNPSIRKYIAQRAELLGAVRLPNDIFRKNAGTEVTADILFLQKRDRIVETEPDWLYLDVDENGVTQNRYFVSHPEMVLGEMVMENTQYGMASTCRPYEDKELESLLSEAVENIQAEIPEYESEELASEETDGSIPADPSVPNFSYTMLEGKIYYRENSRMKPVELSVTGGNRVKGMIAIRDIVRELIDCQTGGYPDEDIDRCQNELNRLYDVFRSRYGLLNARANSMVFSDDNSYPLLCSLEILKEDGTLLRKADMFTKRTICPHKVVERVDTATEALSLSLSEKACINMEYMCSLTGKNADELEKELSGMIFRTPDVIGKEPQFVSEDEYLSGNVREKLKVAKLAAQTDERYQINVAALEKVQPKELTASEISVRLGTTWIPPDDIQEFMFELLDTPNYAKFNMKVRLSKYTGEWQIEGKSQDKGNVKANNTYGTHRASAYKIIEDTLNLRDTRIYDYEVDAEGKKKAILNKEETAIAQGKQDLIKQAFQDWIWKEPERRQRLTDYYNEHFNAIRPREYDGSHLNFPGINPEITLRQHQKNGAARIIYGGNSLLAYVVGAGKTYTMVAAVMECKRLGLCSKSMVVVPNHIIEQFAAEWLQLYPAANILVATKRDFETKNRKKFCARIATSEIDAVIIGHSQFEKIPISVERQRKTLENHIEDIMEGIQEAKRQKGGSFTVKQLQKSKKSLELKLKKLNDQSRKDDVVTFEELGIDRLFIDEADNYKNLYLYTKMRNVGGIAQTEAQKSSDMFMKCRYLDELTGGKGVIFATGTPISNSMVELYTMQRYLQYGDLVKYGLQHFDAWASTFGETVTAIELAPEGTGYRLKTRFARFFNLPELMQMFREVADIQTADMLNLPVPKAEYRVVTVKPSDMQKEMVEELGSRAERVRNGMVNPMEDNMLLITNDGRKLALDQRLANEMLPDEPESKVNACVEEVWKFWENGKEKKLTQLVFCDLSTPKNDGTFSVYNDVRKKLMAKGIPPEEIAFIHDANTEAKKKELFSKVRRGAVRVLMGSTFKMGAGTNVQDLIIASHDLDCPWRPRDLEQRAGRTVRQGNTNKKVDIIRYVTEGTFDAYLYQIIENKQKFISQIMTSKSPARSVEDIDEVALSYAEIKALATGNPYIKEKMDLDIQVSKLQLLKQSFLSQRYEMEDKVTKYYPMEIKKQSQWIVEYQQDIEQVKAHTPPDRDTFPPMQINGVTYREKKEAGQAIIAACKAMTSPDPVLMGAYRGFAMELSYSTFSKDFVITLQGKRVYHVPLGTDIFGNITRIDNEIEKIPDKLEYCRVKLETLKGQLETAKVESKKEFPQDKELSEKVARLGELNALLDMDKKDKVLLDGDIAGDLKEVQERRNGGPVR